MTITLTPSVIAAGLALLLSVLNFTLILAFHREDTLTRASQFLKKFGIANVTDLIDALSSFQALEAPYEKEKSED